jgi:hypothetical protein
MLKDCSTLAIAVFQGFGELYQTQHCCVAVFTRELELYRNPALAGVLPAVAHISTNDDGAAATSWGYTFPPHIVVERGESLNEWCSRVQPNFATTLFVLMHVAKRLAQLHAAGLCHRDLKCDAVSPARLVTMLACCRSPGVIHRTH